MRQSADELIELDHFQLVELLPLHLVPPDSHLTLAEAKGYVILWYAQLGLHAHLLDVVQREGLLCRRQVMTVDLVQILQIGLQKIIHVGCPQLFVSELLLGLRGEIRDNALR